MPTSSISSSQPSQNQYLQTILESARPFLRGELESVDPKLPSLVAVLRSVGAGECWHKHGSFLDHLVDIYKILKLWKAQDSVCLCGLFHSAYSNSYVNLAIFDPSTGRDTVRQHVGEAAERLIHLFCIVPRQPLIHEDLLFKYTDSELVEHLKVSEISLKNAKEKGLFDGEEIWRKKIQTLVPASGITIKHIKTGEDVIVSRRVVAIFLMMTMADFSDQLFGFQDALFDNSNGRLEFSGNSFTALWPGDGKPGLWLNSISRMGAIYSLMVREEEIFIEERKRGSQNGYETVFRDRDEDLELVIPPVFEKCTRVLDAGDQIAARELYWEGVCDMSKGELGAEGVEKVLRKSVEKNPFVGEPYVVLAQICLSQGRYEEAEKEAEKGLTLLVEWGSPWDKRMSWEGWIAWARVLLMKAKEKSWPQTSWGILNLGLVSRGSRRSSKAEEHGSCFTVTALHYYIPYSFGAAASTRVSNELGAGNPNAAQLATMTVMVLGAVEVIIAVSVLYCCRNLLGFAFGHEKEVVDYVKDMTPIICLSVILDSLQAVVSGIARGTGWQHIGAYVNLGAYYLVGIPVALIYGFVLHFGGKGLWLGFLGGALMQCVMLSVIASCTDWRKQARKARERIFEDEIKNGEVYTSLNMQLLFAHNISLVSPEFLFAECRTCSITDIT